MSRKMSNISLAGWLFADLALVLFVIFLPSSVSGDEIDRERSTASLPTTTTTTLPAEQLDGRGVVPEPIEIRVIVEGTSPTRDAVNAAIEAGLRESSVSSEIKFGVIQILAGIRGDDTIASRDSAAGRAAKVAGLLKEIAETDAAQSGRLKPWLYTLSGSDASLRYPELKLRLFPDNE